RGRAGRQCGRLRGAGRRECNGDDGAGPGGDFCLIRVRLFVGKVGLSHVLAAMAVPPELAGCALRVSFGWNSTADEADAFLAAYETILLRQRARRGEAA